MYPVGSPSNLCDLRGGGSSCGVAPLELGCRLIDGAGEAEDGLELEFLRCGLLEATFGECVLRFPCHISMCGLLKLIRVEWGIGDCWCRN